MINPPLRKYLPILIIAPLVIIVDQATKYLIVLRFKVGESLSVLENFFELTHIKNRGAAFGMLAAWDSGARNWVFYLISVLAMTALLAIYAQTSPQQRRIQVPLALIFGGAIGNLLDRITRGEVVDFLLFHWKDKIADFTLLGRHFRFLLSWPAFNIADTAITCGTLFLLVVVLFFDKGTEQHHTHHSTL